MSYKKDISENIRSPKLHPNYPIWWFRQDQQHLYAKKWSERDINVHTYFQDICWKLLIVSTQRLSRKVICILFIILFKYQFIVHKNVIHMTIYQKQCLVFQCLIPYKQHWLLICLSHISDINFKMLDLDVLFRSKVNQKISKVYIKSINKPLTTIWVF